MANVRSIRAILFSAILLLSLGQTGCSVFSTLGGWISHGYDNTVSYFNAYYNAKTLFDEAEAEVLAARSAMKTKPAATFASPSPYPGSQSIPDAQGFQGAQGFSSSSGFPSPQTPQVYQPPAAPQTSSSSKQKFAAVIDKCSNILSFYPKSSVVGDALFLIGKSYFYQDEFVRAERKFSELIVQEPNGPLSLTAQLWLLKTLQRLFRYDDANRVGNELVESATKADETEIAGEALELLGDVAVSQKRPDIALEFYTKSVAAADDGSIKSSAQAKIGDMYVSGEQYDKAASAYVEVSKFSPDPYNYYLSQLKAATAYRRIGQYESAVEILRKLESDYRFMDFWGTIRFELAGTFAANSKLDEAVDLYRLVDTTYARTEQGAAAAFALGRLLQNQMSDYAAAKIAYTHATVGGSQDLTREAQRRATALEKYFRLADQFAKLDSMYFIIDVDSLWMKVDSAALTARKAALDSTARDAKKVTVDSLGHAAKDIPTSPPDAAARRDTTTPLGNLLAERREKVGVAPQTDTTALGSERRTVDTLAHQLPMILVKPRKDTLVASLGNISYQLGELFYTELDVPDSTFLWLSQGLKLGLDSVKSVRALFVLAEVARGNPEKKYGDEKELYRQIVAKYPKSAYAEQSRIALGFPPTPMKVDPAETMFAVAESLMYAGKFQPAIDSLRRIVKDHPESPLTPKSLYAMAWIYERDLANRDSALSQFKTLAAKHPSTKYGEAAQRRIPPVVVDTTKKTGIDPAKSSAADSLAKATGLSSQKASADSTSKVFLKSPTPRDSVSGQEETPLLRSVPKDSARVRSQKREVIE